MKCAWDSLLQILPPWLRQDVDRLGKESIWLNQPCGLEDLNYVVNTASRYSPWAAESIQEGYLTAPGGHRIGFCGQVTVHGNQVRGIRQVESLCIRVARDFEGIAAGVNRDGSILIIGPPGSGKTTLLRDLIRQISRKETVAVVDERGELFPQGAFDQGKKLDVLMGCPKGDGIMMVLRTMGPATVAVDEITAREDCEALAFAGWCGVRLVATVHGESLQDLQRKPLFRPLWEGRLFDRCLVLDREKCFYEERMEP